MAKLAADAALLSSPTMVTDLNAAEIGATRRTEEIERQAREGGTGQGGVTNNIITNNNVSQDNSANTTGQFNNGSSSPDANAAEAVRSSGPG